MDADFPRLVLRYEDLLWRPRETVGAVCDCVGGRPAPAHLFDVVEDVGGGRRRSRRRNLRRYANVSLRYEHLGRADLALLEGLPDQRLVRRLKYRWEARRFGA